MHPEQYVKIEAAVNYLHEHYTEQSFRIETLCNISGISAKYFHTLFTQKFGVPPREYVSRLKLERARELLSDERFSVTEISSLLGYSDVYHFSKVFKAKKHLSPTEYRKMNR